MIREMESPVALPVSVEKRNKFIGEAFGPPNVRVVFAGEAEEHPVREDRVFILIGPASSEKNAMVDALCNFFYDVDCDDPFRYHIANEKFDETTPHKSVISYVFHGTKVSFRPIVVDVQDDKSDLLQSWLKENNRVRIDVVGVVLSAQARVDTTHEAALIQMISLFPAWLRPNICVLLTNSDGSMPPNTLLRRLNIQDHPVFKLNFSMLFQNKRRDSLKEYLRCNYWKMSESSLDALLEHMKTIPPQTTSGLEFEPPRFALFLRADNLSSASSSVRDELVASSSRRSEDTTHYTTEHTIRTSTEHVHKDEHTERVSDESMRTPLFTPLGGSTDTSWLEPEGGTPNAPRRPTVPPPDTPDIETSPTLTKVNIYQSQTTSASENIVHPRSEGIPIDVLDQVRKHRHPMSADEPPKKIIVDKTITVKMVGKEHDDHHHHDHHHHEDHHHEHHHSEHHDHEHHSRDHHHSEHHKDHHSHDRHNEAHHDHHKDHHPPERHHEHLEVTTDIREPRYGTRIEHHHEHRETRRESHSRSPHGSREAISRQYDQPPGDDFETIETVRTTKTVRTVERHVVDETFQKELILGPNGEVVYEREIPGTREVSYDPATSPSTYKTTTYVNGDRPEYVTPDSIGTGILPQSRQTPYGKSPVPIGDSPMVRYVYDESSRTHRNFLDDVPHRHHIHHHHSSSSDPRSPQILSRTETLIDDPYTPPLIGNIGQPPPIRPIALPETELHHHHHEHHEHPHHEHHHAEHHKHEHRHSRIDEHRYSEPPGGEFKRNSPGRVSRHGSAKSPNRRVSPHRLPDDMSREQYQHVRSPSDLRSPGIPKTPGFEGVINRQPPRDQNGYTQVVKGRVEDEEIVVLRQPSGRSLPPKDYPRIGEGIIGSPEMRRREWELKRTAEDVLRDSYPPRTNIERQGHASPGEIGSGVGPARRIDQGSSPNIIKPRLLEDEDLRRSREEQEQRALQLERPIRLDFGIVEETLHGHHHHHHDGHHNGAHDELHGHAHGAHHHNGAQDGHLHGHHHQGGEPVQGTQGGLIYVEEHGHIHGHHHHNEQEGGGQLNGVQSGQTREEQVRIHGERHVHGGHNGQEGIIGHQHQEEHRHMHREGSQRQRHERPPPYQPPPGGRGGGLGGGVKQELQPLRKGDPELGRNDGHRHSDRRVTRTPKSGKLVCPCALPTIRSSTNTNPTCDRFLCICCLVIAPILVLVILLIVIITVIIAH